MALYKCYYYYYYYYYYYVYVSNVFHVRSQYLYISVLENRPNDATERRSKRQSQMATCETMCNLHTWHWANGTDDEGDVVVYCRSLIYLHLGCTSVNSQLFQVANCSLLACLCLGDSFTYLLTYLLTYLIVLCFFVRCSFQQWIQLSFLVCSI